MSVYRRILRGADLSCRFWVALEEEKCAEFGGDRTHPSEKGKGMGWSQWKKGSQRN